MALSENLLRRLKRTFRKPGENMAGAASSFLRWENIAMCITYEENHLPEKLQEVHVEVDIKKKRIIIEYVQARRVTERYINIPFPEIHQTSYPNANSIKLHLETEEYVTLVFHNEASRQDFAEAITISSDDSGNSEGSPFQNV